MCVHHTQLCAIQDSFGSWARSLSHPSISPPSTHRLYYSAKARAQTAAHGSAVAHGPAAAPSATAAHANEPTAHADICHDAGRLAAQHARRDRHGQSGSITFVSENAKTGRGSGPV
eukprot:scaffold836_cov123-Isochrysis_galbana.AAC.9